ncbi:uncharacterized protein TRUGW13939_02962 [Talaromyces rugulosus]|uniref:Uncharacterized protein n=1 Tax=Talaromyces rugulosus TaxID=121627 RepID=A0A7H8QRV7_TALRU|nr:uncharacterized protein TRUGW13939_02962 [Talaromyces rugulosus]QKX55863.1 hypothetical protein TRUGW13939_02962 [Talaromyces rugulosus]
MTSPGGAGVLNLGGNWVMDKAKSTGLDAVLTLQGIGWLTRKAVTASTVNLKITQGSHADTDGVESTEWITLEQVLTGGLRGAPEVRSLSWADFKHDDTLFGPVIVRSHYVPGAKKPDGRIYPVLEVQTQVDRFNIESWLTAAVITDQKTDNLEKAFMHDYICSVSTGWTAEQVWALETTEEGTLLTRKVAVVKGFSTETAHVFYKRQ